MRDTQAVNISVAKIDEQDHDRLACQAGVSFVALSSNFKLNHD